MTWDQFKQYLEKEIIQTEENEEEETTYSLKPEAKSKYSVSQEPELITALTNLIESIENLPYYSSSNSYSSLSEQNEDYYSLPELTNLVNEQGQLITWQQLFPDREKIQFGKRTDDSAKISVAACNFLAKIFNNWIQQITRPERLKALVSEDNIMMKFLLEAAISLNYDLIKRKGYDKQLRHWIKEYNQLGEEEKEELQKQKELVDKLLTAFDEETQNRKEVKEESNWYHNIPWMSVIWWGCGILLVLLVLGWLRNKLKK